MRADLCTCRLSESVIRYAATDMRCSVHYIACVHAKHVLEHLQQSSLHEGHDSTSPW